MEFGEQTGVRTGDRCDAPWCRGSDHLCAAGGNVTAGGRR
jgi:hypothetical protein